MLHETRIYDVRSFESAPEACEEVLRLTWCLYSGFLIEDPELTRPVLLLNDSLTVEPDRYCEYALFVRADRNDDWVQTESVTLNMGDGLTPESLLELVRSEADAECIEPFDSTCEAPKFGWVEGRYGRL